MPEDPEPPYFEVVTPLATRIRTTPSYWEKIITFKHPIMAGQEAAIQQTLQAQGKRIKILGSIGSRVREDQFDLLSLLCNEAQT